MHVLALLSLGGLAAAVPVPDQLVGIDFDVVNAAPSKSVTAPPVGVASQPPTYNPVAAAASVKPITTASVSTSAALVRRDTACAPQPTGAAPTTSPDTDSAFLNNPTYDSIAENAPAPQGYSQVFSDLHGSVEGNGYMGFYTLQSYDTIKCQEYCDAAPACSAFNIYIERDPSVNPGDPCPNPPSSPNYACTLWGYNITASSATNQGQWRDQFHVVIAASNGYNKNSPPPSLPDFKGPQELGGAIQAPVGSYIGAKYFPGPYDPSECASACEQTTAYDRAHLVTNGTYDACNYFNSYVLSKNNVPQGTYCGLYKQPFDKSYSTNYGQTQGGDQYTVSSSYGYTLNPQDPGTTTSSKKKKA